jgi:adenosylcobinamide kinase / adenosylcobinamide-phosphate guanylyltransferase
MSRMVFVIGGARSGKSAFALSRANELPGSKAYLATAQAYDAEMAERIEKHKLERGPVWVTREEPVHVGQAVRDLATTYDAVIIDCLTVWLSNLLCGAGEVDSHGLMPPPCPLLGSRYRGNLRASEASIEGEAPRAGAPASAGRVEGATGYPLAGVPLIEREEADFLDSLGTLDSRSHLFIVSNEVGMGIVPDNELARRFRDMAGKLNQRVAQIADEVFLVAAGIPVKLK